MKREFDALEKGRPDQTATRLRGSDRRAARALLISQGFTDTSAQKEKQPMGGNTIVFPSFSEKVWQPFNLPNSNYPLCGRQATGKFLLDFCVIFQILEYNGLERRLILILEYQNQSTSRQN
jgi:hypothetical protein